MKRDNFSSEPFSTALYFQDQLQNRYWEVLVTQLSCDDYSLAPRQCLQYLTGMTGTLVSFNWFNAEAPYHLSDQVPYRCDEIL